VKVRSAVRWALGFNDTLPVLESLALDVKISWMAVVIGEKGAE